MQNRVAPLSRIWRLRLRVAVLLALPLQVAAALFVWDVHGSFGAYRDFASLPARFGQNDPMPPFDLEQWRFFARDRWRRLLARAGAPSPPTGGPLETFHLSIPGDSIDELDAALPEGVRGDSKNAALQTPDGVLAVKARYMGDNHWHWLHPQKSWRIKLRGDGSWRDREVFAFKNAPSMLTIDEPVVTAIARATGLLAPEVRPVQLHLNGSYAGLYLYWDVTDESLLRRARRMPGSIYSGDGAPADPADGVSMLFRDAGHWQKDASRNAEREHDRSEIERLLAVLAAADPVAFHAFAGRHLDLGRFATFVAIDRAFGCLHHDYHHNHKLYFDPYRGRFEPIEWDVNDWMLELRADRFDAALNPLLIALRTVPPIELSMLRRLHELLDTELAPASVAARIAALDAATSAARAADARRDRRDPDSSRLELPLLHSTFYALDRYQAELDALPGRYAARHERLRWLLGDCRLTVEKGTRGDDLVLTFHSHGRVAGVWTGLELRGLPADRELELVCDRDRDGSPDGDPVVAVAVQADGAHRFALRETLHPGLAAVPFDLASPLLFGRIDLVEAPFGYRWFVRGAGAAAAEAVSIETANAVTGAAVTPAAGRPPEATGVLASCHPWDLPAAQTPRTVTLGPGEVRVEATVRHDASTTLRIAPGTTVRLGPGVSILCRGPVHCEGTAAEPVLFRPLDPFRAWGTFAVQGPGTAGSRMLHCDFEGGSAQDLDMLQLTGMVNVADTADVAMASCRFGANGGGDDALHWAYVRGGSVTGCTFTGAPFDAFDLDLCEDVEVRACRFERIGNDGLDLMTCRVVVRECRFEVCGDKGISVGEATELELSDNTYRHCAIGLQVKDKSRVRAGRIDMAGCRIGISMLRKNTRYSEGGGLTAAELHCRDVQEPVVEAPGFALAIEAISVDGRPWQP